MNEIPHRKLRNDSSAVLREVEAGESVIITNHGRPVARLVPIDEGLPPLRSRPAPHPAAFSDLKPINRGRPIQKSIDLLRGDR